MLELWISGIAAVAFASWVLLAIELLGTHRFWPWVFRIGPPILTEERREATAGSPALSASFDTRSARFQMVAAGSWLFRRKYRLFGMNSVFKGSLALRNGLLIAQSRWPLGLVGFLAAWLFLWCSAGLFALLQPGEVRNNTGIPLPLFALGGVGFVFLMFGSSLWFERRAARRAIDEFVAFGASARDSMRSVN